MKSWKYAIVPILFALAGMGWLLKVVKQLIKGESISEVNIVFACMFFTFAIFFVIAGARKSKGDSGPRNSPTGSTEPGSPS